MSDKFLNNTGLQYYHDRAKTVFADKGQFDTLKSTVEGIVAEGGEPNVIEAVKVNGVAVTPDSDKAVDIKALTASQEGKTVRISNENGAIIEYSKVDDNTFGLSLASIDREDYFLDGVTIPTVNYVDQNGGKINKIKVNGTEQTIDSTDKSVNITVPTVPTDVSSFTNDSGYQTASDVQSAINTAVTSAYIYKGTVATTDDLPTSDNTTGDVYDVQADGMNYAWNGTAWDALGQYVDTSILWTSTANQNNSLVAMTTAEIDAILNPTTGE